MTVRGFANPGMFLIRTWLGAAVMMLAACAQVPTTPNGAPPPWQSLEQANHPLVGKIWRARDGAFIDKTQLATILTRADVVMVGETHDNPDHHRIQAWIVDSLFASGRRPGLAIEMIREDQQAALDAYLRSFPGDIAGLGKALGWQRSGWAEWRHYEPIVTPFAAAGLPILGANLARPMIRALARKGFDALGPRRRLLGLANSIPPGITKAMTKEIFDVHCGRISMGRAGTFARIQISRDAAMASRLIGAARRSGGPGVLIAGSGHVRRDRGVGLHLQRQGFRGHMLSLAPLEVSGDKPTPGDYAAIYGADVLPFDYAWFTPALKRTDPCR